MKPKPSHCSIDGVREIFKEEGPETLVSGRVVDPANEPKQSLLRHHLDIMREPASEDNKGWVRTLQGSVGAATMGASLLRLLDDMKEGQRVCMPWCQYSTDFGSCKNHPLQAALCPNCRLTRGD